MYRLNFNHYSNIIKNYSKPELFEQRDNQSNTILHLLCVSNSNIKLIKMFIYDNLQIFIIIIITTAETKYHFNHPITFQ